MMPVFEDEKQQRALAEALDEVERVFEGRANLDGIALVRAAQALLTAASGTLGECRRDLPYAKMRPVLHADGSFSWCCTHKTQHCSP